MTPIFFLAVDGLLFCQFSSAPRGQMSFWGAIMCFLSSDRAQGSGAPSPRWRFMGWWHVHFEVLRTRLPGQAWPWQEMEDFCPSQGYCQPGFCCREGVKAGLFGGCRLVPADGVWGVGQGHRRNQTPNELYSLMAASGEVRGGFLPASVLPSWFGLPGRPFHPIPGWPPPPSSGGLS